jgi:2-keto-4-pentenoate hydratase/2-oxohepta-3-ene-1,7-dioic acid hydratase in catechol pathway
MKLISFLNNGVPSYGVVDGDHVLDLTPLMGKQAPDLKTLIAHNLFGVAADLAKTHQPTLKFSQLHLLPVIPNPGQIFCIGLNYGEHVLETGREVTETPVIFLRLTDSQVAHG